MGLGKRLERLVNGNADEHGVRAVRLNVRNEVQQHSEFLEALRHGYTGIEVH